jgi:serine/threonine protein kinase
MGENGASQPSDPLVGKTLGFYRIEEVLGIGGMGTVYRAKDTVLDRDVAIKMLPETGEEELARFLREARAAAKLIHPNVVIVYHVGREQNHCYLAMELVRGGNLAGKLRKEGPAPVKDAVEMMMKAANALEAARMIGMVHGDIKPSNLMLTQEGDVKVGDFGLAQAVSEQTGISKKVFGSPLYMAPELCRGQAPTHASDLYALGCTFYQVLTGEPPFRGESLRDLFQKHIDAEPKRPSELRSEIPRKLENIILKCLAKEPSGRYPSAGDLADELEGLKEGEGEAKGKPLKGPLADLVAAASTNSTSRKAAEPEVQPPKPAQASKEAAKSARPATPQTPAFPSSRPAAPRSRPARPPGKRPEHPPASEVGAGKHAATPQKILSPSGANSLSAVRTDAGRETPGISPSSGIPSASTEIEEEFRPHKWSRWGLIGGAAVAFILFIVGVGYLLLAGPDKSGKPSGPIAVATEDYQAQTEWEKLKDEARETDEMFRTMIIDKLKDFREKYPDTPAAEEAGEALDRLRAGEKLDAVFKEE